MKAQLLLQLTSGLLFWGSLVTLGVIYGWKLPVFLFLAFLGFLIHHHTQEFYPQK